MRGGNHGLTNRRSGRVRDKVPSLTAAHAPLRSIVRWQLDVSARIRGYALRVALDPA
jgi:hypothetical protein